MPCTEQTQIPNLVDHLFRHEAGKLVAVLTRLFGSANIELAEDVVQDSLVEAMEAINGCGILTESTMHDWQRSSDAMIPVISSG
jgi:RNA polymerase sigma-70 factor (ECF subfamily)